MNSQISDLKGEKHPLHKLTWEKVAEIRERYRPGCEGDFCTHLKSPVSLLSLAREYGVSKKLITNIIKNRTWKTSSSPDYSERTPLIIKLDIERFWEKVDTQSGPCWNWLGGTSNFGHGRFRTGKASEGMVLAHRFAWEDIMSPVPEEKLVLHKCDNPRCVNPQHLFIGTYKDNMQDMIRKGRNRGGRSKSAF